MTRFLPYGRQSITDEDIEAVVSCLKGDWLTQGPTVAAFEKELCERTGAAYAVAVANGTAALHLAYLGLGIGSDDVGVVPAITFVATANALRHCGAGVVFTDVEPDTGLMRAEDLRAAFAENEPRRPRVVAPVHLTGQPVSTGEIAAIARAHGAFVVEDAAHALGATYEFEGREYRVGSCAHSDAAILSFHPVKHVTTGEGGAVLTNRRDLYERMLRLRTHGIHKNESEFTRTSDDPMVGPWYYEMSDLGYNYRITDLQCALGISQVRRLPSFVARRRELAARYDEALRHEPFAGVLRPVRQYPDRTSAYHLYVVQLLGRDANAVARRRKALYGWLADHHIGAQVHYVPVPWQPYYRAQGTTRPIPGAEQYYASSLSVPLFPSMSDEDVDRVIDALASWARTA